MADIFDILNFFKITMQGKMDSCFTVADKIDGIIRKLNEWKSSV